MIATAVNTLTKENLGSKSFSSCHGEEVTSEFRGDASDAFNRINSANPVSTISSPVGGRILSMATNMAPRQLVFAAKVSF